MNLIPSVAKLDQRGGGLFKDVQYFSTWTLEPESKSSDPTHGIFLRLIREDGPEGRNPRRPEAGRGRVPRGVDRELCLSLAEPRWPSPNNFHEPLIFQLLVRRRRGEMPCTPGPVFRDFQSERWSRAFGNIMAGIKHQMTVISEWPQFLKKHSETLEMKMLKEQAKSVEWHSGVTEAFGTSWL